MYEDNSRKADINVPIQSAIFDMDGTLYELDGESGSIKGSSLEGAIIEQSIQFILEKERGMVRSKAEDLWRKAYAHTVGPSLFLGKRYNMTREEVLSAMWTDVNEHDVVAVNTQIMKTFADIRSQLETVVLLTAAPRAWMERVIAKLGLESDVFDQVHTFEDYKEKQDVFDNLIADFDAHPSSLISIGDSLESEIRPARERGMRVYHVTDQSPLTELSTFMKKKPVPLSNI